MSSTTLTVLSVLLAVVIIAVLAAALIVVRQSLAQTSSKLATLASALETVESEHLKPLEPAVKAINEQFDVIVGAFPGIAAKAKIVAERRPS
jgi:ABC-type oligopeptide transport system substrate-binding subunit